MSPLSSDVIEAGRIYRSTGAIPIDKLRPGIYRAWERAHLQGANPHILQVEKLSRLETERLLERNSYLIDVVRPYLQMLWQTAGRDCHAVLLGSRDAIVLDVIGDEQTVCHSEPCAVPGTLMSEAVAGVNGIGTSLVEENFVEIVEAEHFINKFYPFICQGTPLRNDQGEIVGALSVVVHGGANVIQRLKEILLCASQGIEAEFVVAILEKDVRRVLASNPNNYQPLEELRQDIIQAHQAARIQLEMGSRLLVKRLDYAMLLLQQAEKSIQIFRRRSKIWRNLASLEVGTPQPVSLTDAIRDLVDLLSTEAAIRHIEIVTHWNQPITVVADSKSLLRNLFHYFLQAFESANKGGTVEVEVGVDRKPNPELARVSFKPMPVLNTSPSNQTPYVFTCPIEKNYS